MENIRKKIQGLYIDLIDKKEAIDKVNAIIKQGKSAQIITINPEMIIKASHDNELKNLINGADLILPDGVGIKIALRLKNIKQEQIRGIDFAYSLLQFASDNNLKVGLLGAKEEVLESAYKKIKQNMPNLNIVYKRNGYYDDENAILNEIIEAKPQIMLCALGFPKQEILNSNIKNHLSGCVTIGIGGSFDVWAGNVSEAPIMWRKFGLEWLYRTIKQPERFKRIFPTLPIFLFRSIIEMVGLEAE